MTRYLRLFALQLRVSAASAMAYRANFLIQGAMSLLWTALALLPLIVVFGQRDQLAGWSAPAALILMAYFLAVRAVMEGMISPSLVDLVEKIRSGSFDYVLLKPIDAQAMISASHYEPWRVFDLLGAIAIVIYAFAQPGAPPLSLPHLALGIALFVAGVLAAYALWILCAAASFWVVRLDNLMYLLGAIFDIARWPVDIFRGGWRFVFTFVIPVAVMTTFPAEGLLGRLHAGKIAAIFGGTLALLALSRLVWRTAIRSYTSASS
ncbi:MAG TPA: ABC-2 family transporter protein [Kofleriaceae bacterium]